MEWWLAGVGDAWWFACVPALALALDRVVGEPPVRWHPVVWMGKLLDQMSETLIPSLADSKQLTNWGAFALSAMGWGVAAGVCIVLAVLVQRWLFGLPAWLAALALALVFKPLFAWAMLHDEVASVESGLGKSLESGRAQLNRLVSRDVRALSAHEVRESAIESLAENLNDSLVAPMFWFALLGLPGAVLFRFANTADAMWGYRGFHRGRDWTWAGKWAARADDVLAWIPARITALLILLCSGAPSSWRAAQALRAEARRTPSPNGGWPMAAMALVLGVRLGKPGVYVLHQAGRSPEPADTLRACAIASRSAAAATLLACAVLLYFVAA